MNAIAFDTFQNIDLADLQNVAGGFDWNRMVDNGNRYGTAGALGGAAVGAAAAAVPSLGIAAPAGAGVGGAIGGALGWAGGAGYDAIQQLRGK